MGKPGGSRFFLESGGGEWELGNVCRTGQGSALCCPRPWGEGQGVQRAAQSSVLSGSDQWSQLQREHLSLGTHRPGHSLVPFILLELPGACFREAGC